MAAAASPLEWTRRSPACLCDAFSSKKVFDEMMVAIVFLRVLG
jgi:1,2-phenylacetyl-CoA epoxidase catalytic subunit